MAVVAIKQYVEFRNQGYWIIGTRISLDSIVYVFLQGLHPESIVRSYPLLDLEQIYGAITFYLANRAEIDAYLLSEVEAFHSMSQFLATEAPDLHERLIGAKRSSQSV